MLPMSTTTSTILTLVLGAGGALIAIFLKEAVQHALQRRVVVWQLSAYLMSWKSQIIRAEPVARIYLEVEKQDAARFASLAKGSKSFHEHHAKHKEAQAGLRQQLRAAIQESVAARKLPVLDELQKASIDETIKGLERARNELADAKTFLSDRDAAVLGRAVAMSVVQFRFAFQNVLLAVTTLLRLSMIESEHAATTLAAVVDQLVVHGEDCLVAMIRLEKSVDRLSKRSVPQLTWDVLTAK